jgi:hypothetical protein
MSSSTLSVASGEEKDYVLEGVFGQIDQKNRNNRIYTEDEYVPQIEALQQKISSSKLLGELDHPTQFDTSLKNVSHIVEELYYDKDTKEVRGRIRLLDTDAGRQAKALVDAGVPLQISSRAAGAVESNGKVKIKQLFTYDLVADPGFENAELKRVNESYGFSNDSGVYIYEMGGANVTENIETQTLNTEIKENKNMAEFVKAEDFNKYSEYLAKEIKGIKESIDAKTAEASEDMTVENLKSHNDHIAESVNNLSEYVGYLAEKLDQGIQYTEHVAEKADQGISYSEHVAEKLDQSIQYGEHIAEAVAKVKDFANYLAEAHNEGAESSQTILEYIEYLRGNLQSVSEYAEYIAESINENVITEEDDQEFHSEEVEEDTTDEIEAEEEAESEVVDLEDKVEDTEEEVETAEDVTEEVEGEEAGIEGEDVVKKDEEELEEIGDNSDEGDVEGEDAGEEGEDVVKKDEEELEEIGDNAPEGDVEETGDEVVDAEDLEDETVKSDSEIEDETEEAEAGDSDEEAEGEDGAHDPLEAYKNEISSKLNKLVESAQIKENENPSFFRVVSTSTVVKYNALTEDAKTEVRSKVAKRGFMTESEIVSLIESSQLIVENRNAEPFFLAAMPTEYRSAWENLSESKKNQIEAQSKYHTLNTEYQVRNFWQTRDLRDTKIEMEKVEMVKESKTEEVNKPAYDVSAYAEELKKRFKK